jgi:hypothetical protein
MESDHTVRMRNPLTRAIKRRLQRPMEFDWNRDVEDRIAWGGSILDPTPYERPHGVLGELVVHLLLSPHEQPKDLDDSMRVSYDELIHRITSEEVDDLAKRTMTMVDAKAVDES